MDRINLQKTMLLRQQISVEQIRNIKDVQRIKSIYNQLNRFK